MGALAFRRQRLQTLVKKVGHKAASELARFGIDSAEKLDRVEEVLRVQGYGDEEHKKVKAILKGAGHKTADPNPRPAESDPDNHLAEVPEGAGFPYSKGGGWYILSDGSQIHGKKKATEAQEALREA